MKIKKIITSGCSFSDPATPYTWPNVLQKHVDRTVEGVSFTHTGLSSQGQELIQKKALFAITEALSQGFKPEEIAVFVMWSGTERKTFYINNPDTISNIVSSWKNTDAAWSLQFGDLTSSLTNAKKVETLIDRGVMYNPEGGWYIPGNNKNDLDFIKEFYLFGKTANDLGPSHTSLENIILLQLFCKLNNIQLYQQFYMDYVLSDIESFSDNQIINYLYKQLDWETFISKQSIHGFLLDNPSCFKSPTDAHPNGLGHRIWFTDVILPFLQQRNFFN